ncbi:hypothetical protein [Frigoribacterium faeni]|uniref:hypothetical protein n=1 Tax=Frigoribacterium faeni TaxID=145483 RepID=UPI00141B8695|nr:hypothetical protein [Frigoribacterium faeni]NIJ04789.1 hypothetical protein [Frigoribacterium faeni]
MTATIDVDLEALEGMAAALATASEGLPLSHALTGDCTSVLGCGAVAAALSEVSLHVARRADLVVELIGRLAALPAEFAAGLRLVDESLATQATGATADAGARR